MTQAKGYAAKTVKAALAPFTFERRAPRDQDVAIEIKYCGICHSDIHQARDEWGGSTFPMVPGHEIAGVVTAVGSKVTKFKVGDPVGVGCMVDSCRTCAHCEQGLEQYCLGGATFTYNSMERDGKTPTYGGYSDHVVVDESFVLHMPKNLPLDAAAPLLCAGITLYSPLMHWKAGPGKKVAILGLGGLGHMGVKIAKALGAEVTVLSHSARKEADAKNLGAHHFFATSDASTFETLKNHFDLIINTVSADIDWNQYLSLLKLDGSMVVVGVPEKPNAVSAFSIIAGRKNLSGSMIGGIQETQEMLDFCGKHNITCDIEIIPIQKVNEAYERVLKSDVRYRFVIDMASLR
ncbi:MAG: NAD(P)-dependent alcohol dehydrogenase [Deltaproteobacteria bacterium]|nr:NAD(P)-dependent alcohol dehydrogenase [Deltaproteobacteria bacterium]